MKRILILAALLMVTACSEDGPLVPLDPAVTMDRFVRDFAAALEAGDVAALDAMINREEDFFYFNFSPWDEHDHELPTWYMRRSEFVQALGNICSGQPLKQEDGTFAPAITGLEITRLAVDLPWEPPPGDMPDHYLTEWGIWTATYHFEMVVHREGMTPLEVGKKLMFQVRPLCDTAEGCWNYTLMRIRDLTGRFDPATTTTLGTLMLEGFLNSPPEFAPVLRQLYPGSPQVSVVVCDLMDEGRPLERGEVRFRRVPDTEWTPWSDDCEATAIFESYGEHQVEVQARDRWGIVGSRTATIELLPPPGP